MSSLVSLQAGPERFPITDCAACGRRSLTWVDIGPDGAELRRCLSCDAPADLAPSLVPKRAAERLGYAFLDPRRLKPKSKGGCGSGGVRSCGSGGCSSGGGGCSSGGCSSGGCGV